MEKVILVGGQAGQGSDRTSLLIAETLTSLGFYVFNYRDYPSLIKGGHNFNILKISDKPVYSHENSIDVILALDQKTVDIHKKDLRTGGFILSASDLDIQSVLKKLKAPPIFGNNILLGALFKLLGLPLTALEKTFEKQFGPKAPLLKKSASAGYQMIKSSKIKLELPARRTELHLLSGSQAVAKGAIQAGIDIYFAYPMTPATPVLHLLAAQQEKAKIKVVQLENEIAVINAALGASYAGAMTMTGTSGGGFALMSEAMSLSGMAEIPLVVYLAQRTAPATGVPTYTGQGDLKFALNIGHGEFPRIVVAPGDPDEAISRTIEAFYLACKYQTLAIILSDKHLAESGTTFSKFSQLRVKPDKFLVTKPPANYQRYQITKNGISPRAIPGQGPMVRATSYEHDEMGYTIEDAEGTIKMNDKRMRKLIGLKKEINSLEPVSFYGQGKKLIVAWGSTKGAILDALKSLSGWRLMQISYLQPFPVKIVSQAIKQAQEVVLVENNVTGLLADVIAEQTGQIIKKKLLKYDARPFTSQDVIKGIRRINK